MENYTRMISLWIQKEHYPILGLWDLNMLFAKLLAPLERRFIFLGTDYSFFEGQKADRRKQASLWNDISSYSDFLGEIFPGLLPFHFYVESSGKIKSIPENFVVYYARIYEDCIKILIRGLFKECQESIECHRPLTLDLSLGKPIYYFQEWEKVNSFYHSDMKGK